LNTIAPDRPVGLYQMAFGYCQHILAILHCESCHWL